MAGAAAALAGAGIAGVVAAGPAAAAAQVSLSPTTGPAGSAFTVTGSGFPAADVEIRWDTQSGPLLATATGPDFSVPVVVPDDAVPNSHPVLAVVRNGNAVSTSSAAYQVAGGATDPVTTTTTVAADTTTTAAPVVTTSPPATSPPATSAPSGAGSGGVSGRAASGVTGGIEPSLLETTTGQAALAAGDGAGGTATSTTVAVTPTAAGATGAAGANGATAATGPSASAGPDPAAQASPAAAARTPGVAAPTTAKAGVGGGDALGSPRTSSSSAPVRSPALLVLGLLLVLAGAAFLAVRNQRRPAPADDIPFTSSGERAR